MFFTASNFGHASANKSFSAHIFLSTFDLMWLTGRLDCNPIWAGPMVKLDSKLLKFPILSLKAANELCLKAHLP
jgi:hypothetical protein